MVPSPEFDQRFPAFRVENIFKTITLKTSLGDALFIGAIRKFLPLAKAIVSWDKEHLVGKSDIEVISPKDFLERLK